MCQATIMQHLFQRVVYIGAHLQTLRKGFGSDWHNHELLQIDAAVGVLTTVRMFIIGTGRDARSRRRCNDREADQVKKRRL
jgi:hypothetical protein